MSFMLIVRKILLILVVLMCAVGCQAQNETNSFISKGADDQAQGEPAEKGEEPTLSSAEEQLDRFIEEFQRLADTLVSQYKKVKPKLEKLGTIVQEKLQELEGQVQQEPDSEQ